MRFKDELKFRYNILKKLNIEDFNMQLYFLTATILSTPSSGQRL